MPKKKKLGRSVQNAVDTARQIGGRNRGANAPALAQAKGNDVFSSQDGGRVTLDGVGANPDEQFLVNGHILSELGKHLSKEEGLAFIKAQATTGRQIYQALLAGQNPQPAASRENAAALLWYLKLLSERAAGHSWMKGAFTIPDPDGNLHRFLLAVQEIYLRSSTHLREEQSPQNIPGGIDFYTGHRDSHFLLPYGLNTALLQQVLAGDKQNQRLYVKFEGEGARLNTFNLNPFVPNRPANAPRDVSWKFQDLSRSCKHGLEVFFNTGNFGMQAHRENTPKEVTDAYMALLDFARSNANNALGRHAAALLEQGFTQPKDPNKAGDAMRIHQIWKNVNALLEVMEAMANLGLPVNAALWQKLVALRSLLRQKYDPNTLNNRFGDEIVIV